MALSNEELIAKAKSLAFAYGQGDCFILHMPPFESTQVTSWISKYVYNEVKEEWVEERYSGGGFGGGPFYDMSSVKFVMVYAAGIDTPGYDTETAYERYPGYYDTWFDKVPNSDGYRVRNVVNNAFIGTPNLAPYMLIGPNFIVSSHLTTLELNNRTWTKEELDNKIIYSSTNDLKDGNGNSVFVPDFVPDDGKGHNPGGGNQNWGQGNPATDTTGGTYDNTSDIIAGGTSTSFKAGQAYNNYWSLTLKDVLEVKEKIWGLNIPFLTKPSEGIISLLAYPFDLTSRSFDSTSKNVLVGNSFMVMEQNAWLLNANFDNIIDFGSIKIDPYFGGFQDYAPYTKIQIYMPFIGVKDLDPTYVQGKTLNVKYNVNFTTGSCIACVYSEGILYQRYNGQLAQTVPLTQVNNNLIESTASIGLQLAGSLATGGASAIAGLASASLSAVSAARPSISGSAGGGGESELSLPLECFLIIERPQCVIAQTYNHEKGRPSLVNKKLSNCKGFTSMSNPQCTATCTSEENDMINNLLKEGVIIL